MYSFRRELLPDSCHHLLPSPLEEKHEYSFSDFESESRQKTWGTWGFGCAVVGRFLMKESGVFLHEAKPRFGIVSFGKVPLEFICSHVPTYSDSHLDIIWLLFKLKLLTRATNDHDSNHFTMTLVHSELLCSQKIQSSSQLYSDMFQSILYCGVVVPNICLFDFAAIDYTVTQVQS